MSALVLLSGWGIDARIWAPLRPHWPADLRVTAPDWPGYGTRRGETAPADLAVLAEAMAESLPEDAVWVGWSLGGLLAGALLTPALRPRRAAPRALVMLGMGARFTDAASTPVTAAELTAFRAACERDPLATWRHFLRWQLRGEPHPRQAHRRLIELIGEIPTASPATLSAGLDQLARLDLARLLEAPPCPVIRLRGDHDPLCGPTSDAEAPLTAAGHCPQLSQPQALAERLAGLARRLSAASASHERHIAMEPTR